MIHIIAIINLIMHLHETDKGTGLFKRRQIILKSALSACGVIVSPYKGINVGKLTVPGVGLGVGRGVGRGVGSGVGY